VWEESHLSILKQTLSWELRAMGFRKLSARPRHHASDADAAMAFKNNVAADLAEIASRDYATILWKITH
jgi:hypothetical protein